MAVTGLDFSLPTIRHLNHDTAFIPMDRRSIDLNKHAIDLNETPTNDLNLDFHDASTSHELGSSLLPRKGGWLELFRNMFGQEKIVLDGFPFASRAAPLDSSSSNNTLQANGRIHSDVRIDSTRAVYNPNADKITDQKLDMSKQSVSCGSKLSSLLLQGKDIRTSKLPMFKEFNHGNFFNTLPISEHTGISAKSFYNAGLGQHGCQNDYLNSAYVTHAGADFNAGIEQQMCEALGQPQHSNGFHTSFHPISEQGRVGSSLSHSVNDHKASLPLWDLNSQPIPNFGADLQPLGFQKAPCSASPHLFPQHPGKQCFTATQAEIMENVKGPCAQVSDGSLTNLTQENVFSEKDVDFKALSMCLEKDQFLCSQKKSSGGSHGLKVLGSISGDILPLPSSQRGKGLEHRVRIIASPEWLPAGWITEVKTRMAGSTAGTTDKYYKDPVTGRRFRSKNEVFNFLQTGRLTRNKPQVRFLEGFPAVTNLPLLLPGQEQRVAFPDSFQALAEKHASLPFATDLSSQTSICETRCPPSVIRDKISVKHEQDDMVQGCLKMGRDKYRILDVTATVESRTCNTQEIPGLEVLKIEKHDMPIRAEPTSVSVYQEPVYSKKRQSISNCDIQLPSKRLRSAVKELQNQEKWTYCTSPFQRESESQTASMGAQAIKTRITNSGYPRLPYQQETNGSQDQVISQYCAAKYRANARALGLCVIPCDSSTAQVNVGLAKELLPKPVSFCKVVEKKFPKLTLKQERDLFITLGRKLCREFLAAAKESCLQ